MTGGQGTTNIPERSKLGRIFRSLRHRNFRLFFMGQSISLIGTWMQMVAVSWLVYRLTHSALMLGLVPFIGRLPTLFLAPFVGVFVDRMNRHRLVIIMQTLAMIQALVLAALMFSGHIAVWNIILLQVVLGFISTMDMPARQSFMIQMLDDRQDLTNAIALNSSIVNGARLIGPTLAGLLIVAVGEGWCFLLNGLSYIAVIGGLLAMKVQPNARVAAHTRILHNLKEGFHYALGFPPIRAILLLLAVVSLMGQSYAQLLPVFAKNVLHGNSATQGYLLSAVGVGALCAAIYLAMRTSVRGLGRVISVAPSIMGLGLIGLGLSHSFWLSMAVMPIVGLGMMSQMASSNTILQTITDDDKRGRVMGFYSMSFQGMVPLGSLIAGGLAAGIAWLAARFGGVNHDQAVGLGARCTVILGGLCCIAGSIQFASKLPALRELVHPIYIRKGIIPIATAVPLAGAPNGGLSPLEVPADVPPVSQQK
jgi:MFS family permease